MRWGCGGDDWRVSLPAVLSFLWKNARALTNKCCCMMVMVAMWRNALVEVGDAVGMPVVVVWCCGFDVAGKRYM
jgi:hypothetical protein